MLRRQKKESTFETWEKVTWRGTGREITCPCPKCSGKSQMVTPEHLHQMSGFEMHLIWKAIELKEVHALEIPNGSALVCVESMRDWVQQRRLPGAETLPE